MVLKRQLAVDSIEVLRRNEGDPVVCPVCAKEHRREDLESVLSAAADTSPDDGRSNLRALNERLQQADSVTSEIQQLRGELDELEQKAKSLIDAADELREFADAVNDGQLADVMRLLSDREASIDAEIQDQEKWCNGIQAELSKLGEEERYHQTQNSLHELRIVKTELQRARRTFEQLVSFGESVRDIHDAVKSCLTEQLEDKVPGVAEELTQVFVALTRHPHFDRLIIDKKQLPHLELQVSSSHYSTGLGHRTGVLNGQASSALELVPYFALSQANKAPTEVYLVLLDDPTRAFDPEHVEILIERLADLGRRVQLIVASQETARFRKLLPRSFEPQSYVVVEPKNWSYADGPELDTGYE